MVMLSKSERIQLRSLAQTMPDLVYIGKEGLTDNVIRQVDDNLFAHELIKIKVQNTCDIDKNEIADMLCEKLEAEVVTIIGTKIVLYKWSDKDKIKHILH